ncbi:hypothetical protein CR513_48334, partial [Mucuna pruriens]
MSSFNLIFTVLHECIIPHVSEIRLLLQVLLSHCLKNLGFIDVVVASESYKNLPESNFNHSGLRYCEAHLTQR